MLESLLALDGRLTTRLRVAEKPGALRSLAVLFAHSGDSWFWLVGLLWLWYAGSQEWKTLVLWLAGGIAVTALIVFAIKLSVRRQRPAGEWGEIYRRTDPHSFPSGHAARALMLAVLGLGLGPAWLGWLLLLWAPLVMLARVAMGVHYLSDVLAGGLIGVLIGLGVLWLTPLLLALV
jgi:undecaprenyl-diphosphatase